MGIPNKFFFQSSIKGFHDSVVARGAFAVHVLPESVPYSLMSRGMCFEFTLIWLPFQYFLDTPCTMPDLLLMKAIFGYFCQRIILYGVFAFSAFERIVESIA